MDLENFDDILYNKKNMPCERIRNGIPYTICNCPYTDLNKLCFVFKFIDGKREVCIYIHTESKLYFCDKVFLQSKL